MSTEAPTPRYRCTVCGTIVETADTEPVCNTTRHCGFLYEDELVPAHPVPTRRGLGFQLDGDDYMPGDDRAYTVHYRGHTIGLIERCWLVPRTAGDPPPAGWSFISGDRRHSGEGRTRADAVIAAYSRPA